MLRLHAGLRRSLFMFSDPHSRVAVATVFRCHATHAERFKRPLPETFVAFPEDVRFDDLAAWLLADKIVLPHHRLGRQAPGPFLLQHQPEGQPIQKLDTILHGVL